MSGKKFLFSPIGGTDPISNNRDGSFLHICRIYRPDKVYLFLSKEIYEYHVHDDRYLYCLRQLGELINHDFEYEVISEKELSEVQDYNYFYRRFRDIVRDIFDQMESDDILYVNTSSGTPAMKSALQVMSAVTEYRFIPIQVKTPARAMNQRHEDKNDYAPDVQWICNLDNEAETFENRCEEVECQNLMLLMKIDLIRKFVAAYDYRAARIVADEIREELSADAYGLIAAAEARLQLDKLRVKKSLKGMPYSIIPVQSKNQRDVVEYLLALEIKLKKGEYADFLRGITPVTADLFELILENQYGVTVEDYCIHQFNGRRKWNLEALQKNPQIWEILSSSYREGFHGNDISSEHMLKLIEGKPGNDVLRRDAQDLREIEKAVRNAAAHDIVSVTESWIKERTADVLSLIHI